MRRWRRARGATSSRLAALVFARSGREADAERLAAELDRDYPQYTLVQRYWLSSIRGALALAAEGLEGVP